MSSVQLQQDSWAANLSHNQTKALSLLGQGISPVMVASTLGVTESLISQYISEPRFSEEVTKLKLAGLQAQTDVDNKYLKAETMLVDKLIKTIPLISKPMDILRGIQVINATKRRGMADGAPVTHHTNIVQINLPAAMAAKFITNTAKQIVEIHDDKGARSLVTSTPEAVSKYATEWEAERATERESIGISEDAIDTGWESATSTADRIKQASEVLSRLAAKEVVSQGQISSTRIKGQITADDL